MIREFQNVNCPLQWRFCFWKHGTFFFMFSQDTYRLSWKKIEFLLCNCFMSGNTLGARCSWNKHPLEVEELRGASLGNSLLQRHITLHIKTLIKQGFPPNSKEEITYLTGQFHVFYTFFLPPSRTLVPPQALYLAQVPEARDFRHKLPSLYPAPTMLSSLTSPGCQRRYHNFPSHALKTSSNYLIGSLRCNPHACLLPLLGPLLWYCLSPWASPYTWSTLPPSQVSLHYVNGLEWQATHQCTIQKIPFLKFFVWPSPGPCSLGFAFFLPIPPYPQWSVLPTSYPPIFLSYLPFPIYLPSYLPSPSFTLNTTLSPLLLLLCPPLHHHHLSSFFHFAINNKKLCRCHQLCRY